MITTPYNASDVFVVRLATPLEGNPVWMALRIDSNGSLLRGSVGGAGLYAIHFQDRLLYVGKFLGKRSNPFGGDVCRTRWAKHLGTLTLRDRRVSLNRNAINDMRSRGRHDAPLADIVAAAAHPVIRTPRGCVSSLNRALFAAEHWGTLSQLADARGLDGFTITYTRLDAEIAHTATVVRTAVDRAELQVIAKVRPRCNAVILDGSAGEMSLKQTRHIFENALAAALSAAAASEAGRTQADSPREEPPADGPDDAVAATAEEAFLEQMEDNVDARSAFDSICAAFDTIADAFIGHTMTGGGDFRIRSIIGRHPFFFNVAATEWRRKLGQFSAEIDLPVARCLELGASTAEPNYVSRTLGTRATFRVPEATVGMVQCLVEAAYLQRNKTRSP